jgi:hypothetical protein
MNEAAEESSRAIVLVTAIREGLGRSREPAHFYGLVRGLDIALSTLGASHADQRAALRQLRERAARMTRVDTYHTGVATGLELASDLTMRWLLRYSPVSPHSMVATDEAQRVK